MYRYIYIYCSYWSNTTYLVTFPEMTIVRCSRRYLFFKIWRKDNRRIFRNVRGCNIFFRGFPVLMASSLRPVLQTHLEICIFCSAIQYIKSKKQPV